jgi:hypothetical protein
MKLRIVFDGKKYHVEVKRCVRWRKLRYCPYNEKVTLSGLNSGLVDPVVLWFMSYDEALQCANDYIESKKAKRPKIICEEIEI